MGNLVRNTMSDSKNDIDELPETITVAVVEDNGALRQSLQEILDAKEGMKCVGVFSNGEEALRQLPQLEPAVVLMDINLPEMTGVDCVRQLVKRMPQVLVIMVTIQSNIDAVFASLQAGACGYLHKPVYAKELLKSVRDVVAGGSPMSAGIARKVVQAFKTFPLVPTETVVKQHRDEQPLTDREHSVLDLLAQGYSYKEISDKIGVSWHTVHNHIRHIYEKLQVQSRGQAVAKFRSR